MGDEDVLAELKRVGAVLQGHFRLASGRHGDLYIEKFRILEWPEITARLVGIIARRFLGEVSLVAGPTTGGAIVSFDVARQMGLRTLIAEKQVEDGAKREFRREQSIGPGDQVLIVDDVLTTGGSINEVIKAVEERGASLAGVGVLVDRTGGKVEFGAPFQAALSLNIVSWLPDECPLCRQGEPLTVT